MNNCFFCFHALAAHERLKPRMKGLGLLFCGLLTAACVLPLSAASPDGLTIEQAVEIALAGNPDVLNARFEIDAARGRALQLGARPDPQLSASVDGASFPGRTAQGGETEFTLGLEQVFEFPGKRSLKMRIGRLDEEQAALALERTRLIVKAKVKKAYYDAVLAMKTIDSLNQAIAILDQVTDNLMIKYQAGSASYSDILRAKVERARTQNQIIEMQNESESAKERLNLIMGRKGEEPLELLTAMAFTPLEKNISTLRAEAREGNPSLRAMRAQSRQAQASLQLSYKNRLPDFSLGLYYPSKRSDAWGIAVGLNLPVWGAKQRGAILEARALQDIVDTSLDLEERHVMARVDRYQRCALAAAEQVKLFEQKLLKDIADEVHLGIGQLQYGQIEFFNLLDLFRTYSSAQLEYLKALHLYLVSLTDIELVGEEYPD
jgi:cobalt-zinc-cadmium efflux system outer membrane protein